MKQGGGKQKGAKFERQVCVALSRWVSNGEQDDLYWRSAMSGGRASRAVDKSRIRRVAGDVCATAPEGQWLVDRFFIECKHVKSLRLGEFIVKQVGPLWQFWETAYKQAIVHNKEPMLIAKQNGWPVLVLTTKKITVNICFIKERQCHITFFESLLITDPQELMK